MSVVARPAAAMPSTSRTSDPRDLVASVEAAASLPSGIDERFSGWGVMGLPFSSGHYLALRRFPASSVGPAYASVWWRNPANEWTMFTTVPAELSCPRYFGRALAAHAIRDITLTWTTSHSLRVSIPDELEWEMTLGSSVASRLMSMMGAAMPKAMWLNSLSLAMIGRTAPLMLRAGNIKLEGSVPNGQHFQANPRRLWLVTDSSATLRGHDLGSPSPLAIQTRLGDLWLPQKGMFFIGEAYLEAFDPSRHVSPKPNPSAARGAGPA